MPPLNHLDWSETDLHHYVTCSLLLSSLIWRMKIPWIPRGRMAASPIWPLRMNSWTANWPVEVSASGPLTRFSLAILCLSNEQMFGGILSSWCWLEMIFMLVASFDILQMLASYLHSCLLRSSVYYFVVVHYSFRCWCLGLWFLKNSR